MPITISTLPSKIRLEIAGPMERLLSSPSFSSLEQGQGLQYLIEASRARNITDEEVKAILKLPVLNKPWDAVVFDDLVDTTGRRLLQKELTLNEVKSAINPPYILRWLLMMTKEASENHCITDTHSAACEFLRNKCFQAALDTLKEPICNATYKHLYLAISMGTETGPWNEINENDESVCIDIIYYLIEECKLEINQVRRGRETLTLAVKTGSKKIVECLIQHGANVNFTPEGKAGLLALANQETATYLRSNL